MLDQKRERERERLFQRGYLIAFEARDRGGSVDSSVDRRS